MLFGTCNGENDEYVFEYAQKSPEWAGRFGEPFSEGERHILVLFKRGCMLSVVVGLSFWQCKTSLYVLL